MARIETRDDGYYLAGRKLSDGDTVVVIRSLTHEVISIRGKAPPMFKNRSPGAGPQALTVVFPMELDLRWPDSPG